MKRNYRYIVAAVLLVVCIATIWYGQSVVSGEVKKEVAEDEVQTYAWPLATCSTTDTVTHVFATTFAEQVAELSDGKMQIQVYPQSTLGGDRELMESCKDGDIPFVVQSPAPQVTFMPELAVFDSPCVFDTIEEARETIDNPDFLALIQDVYEGAGYELLGLGDQTFRVMTSAKEFTGMESFKGQKIRTMENSYHIQFWKAMGANPTPMTFSEVYIGLQQGTIDAQENAYALILSAKLYEQQKYLIQTNAVPDYVTLIASSEFMDTLSESQQEIIREAAKNAQAAARESADEKQASSQAALEEAGMTVVTPDEETWAEMQKRSEAVYDSIRKVTGDELMDLYLDIEK